MNEKSHQPAPSLVTVESPVQVAEFPNEPFACPACGQMLAPSCRVCVACKHVIDPAAIVSAPTVQAASAPSEGTQPKLKPVRFSWPLFFVVFGVSCFLVLVLQGLWTDQQKILLVMGGLQTLAGVWVFFDALREKVPKPLRWSIGSMLLPLVIFPWYLARRRIPQAPVPFLEGGPVIRLVILALLLFFLANLIYYFVQGPPPGNNQTQPSQKSGGSRVTLDPPGPTPIRALRQRQARRPTPGTRRS